MSTSANVKSIESVRDFRIALTTFAEDARNALSAVEMEIRRTRDWLQRDQLGHWQAQIKRRNELLSMARTELHRRRLSQSNSDAISDTEQKENVRTAQRRLEEAEQKLQCVKRWVPVLEHAIAEYHAASQPLGDRLTGSLQNSIMLLDRMVATLESYLAIAPPSTPATAADGTSRGPAAAVSEAPAATTPEAGPVETNEQDAARVAPSPPHDEEPSA